MPKEYYKNAKRLKQECVKRNRKSYKYTHKKDDKSTKTLPEEFHKIFKKVPQVQRRKKYQVYCTQK